MIFFFFYNLISIVSSAPTIDCFVGSKKCVVDQNLFKTQVGVKTMEECSILCRDYFDCTAFTHFGPNSVFLPIACLLFSSCGQREPCDDCVSGTGQNECECGIEFEGPVDTNNFVDLVPNVADESSCKNLCAGHGECNIYTFYNNKDPIKANMCFLLTSKGLQQPVTFCENCKTGPARCETGQKCQVAVIADYRKKETDVFFLNESTTLDFVAGGKDCFHNITVLAIGGGGSPHYYGSGGGSGYVDIGNMTLISDARHSVPIEVTVGGPGEPSFVEGGGVNASMGNNGNNKDGGDGYSGGGGSCGSGGKGGYGGSNGGNGEGGKGRGNNGKGGKGSGLNLDHIALTNFVLTPAKGGLNYYAYGGGGGGVFVNGKGPHGDDRGRGFGGGEERNQNGNMKNGNSGCILIEF